MRLPRCCRTWTPQTCRWPTPRPNPSRIASSARRWTLRQIRSRRNRPRPPKLTCRPVGLPRRRLLRNSRDQFEVVIPGRALARTGIPRLSARDSGPREDACPGMTESLSLRRNRLFALRLDLADRVDHGIEGQHRRGMPSLVVAHRLEQPDIGPLALRRAAVFLQHLAHGLAQFTQFARGRADDVACHDRGGGLAERTGLYIMGKVADQGSVHSEVDLDGRTAQFGMRCRAGIGCGQSAEPGDVAGQFDDALVVDVVQHKIESLLPGSIALGDRVRWSYI